jgi:fatty-acyl-CoA synthase
MIEGMAQMGFDITHVYGLTEVYGPASVAVKRASWATERLSEQVRLNGRQGVRYPLQESMAVLNPESMLPLDADGTDMGEIMFQGNLVMKGYLKNPAATAKAFEGGWFHTGDLAVMEPDRYVKIKDRSKDIIISGGENISSIEVEDALYRHPAVLACAVCARNSSALRLKTSRCGATTPTASLTSSAGSPAAVSAPARWLAMTSKCVSSRPSRTRRAWPLVMYAATS